MWRGHTIALRRTGNPDAAIKVILIHGFGASSGHWRHTLPALADGADVIALDLLGFGASSKPRSRLADEADEPGAVRYCFDLWAEQVVDAAVALFAIETRSCRLHLVGNSIGGMVALNAARLLRERGLSPAQVVLLDCAQRALDDKRLAQLPAWQRPSRPLLKALVRQRAVIAPLFRLLARPAFIRRVLARAYPSTAHVDDELVELLFRPSTDPGALESFRGFVNLFNDHLAPQLLDELSRTSGAGAKPIPVRLIWGEADPWEDPAEARRWAAHYACIEELVVLPGVGHCPHDEAPELVNPLLRRWIGCSPVNPQRA
ncbi:alpha/beta fold hydrolase [Cyanobium sp. ATX 6A2]|uniref:alpha/beta fold hydrolase n=1 Tax=Cyanobium sp. ATX 6A2 TaxID=2823700 RepID=UPI0020CF50BD|nr:alpha/beta fold hydrolase [Cyanobium sp. ATX 6A2]